MADPVTAQFSAPARLRVDGDALVSNWRAMAQASGSAQTGAAVKANSYGLGARDAVRRLSDAGCRDFFVAHWQEAAAIADLVSPGQISVLNGVSPQDANAAILLGAVPVLNTPAQIAGWRAGGGGRCHVMLDTGINRLGIGPAQISSDLLGGLDIDILMSHLASADEDVPQNQAQLDLFMGISAGIAANRRSLANSAGIMLGSDYHFDLTRPGLALYGGIPRAEMATIIQQVAYPQARILQIRNLNTGDPVGYNATFRCPKDMPVATAAMGYADGYKRAFSGIGHVKFSGVQMPIIGRVSMDLITIDVSGADHLREGDWLDVVYDLAKSSEMCGVSQYELLTGLSVR